jgi:Bacterial regulatory proteins, luxR family
VLALMAEGRSNGAIAGILVVSERGVENHVGNIFSKLGLAPSDADHRRVLAGSPLPGALTDDTAGTDLTHHARSPVLGYGTTAAGSLPLLTCTGSWGIGGTSGI